MFVDEDLPDDNLEGAVGGEIDHHTSQEQTDMESDSKGDLSFNAFIVLYHYIVKYQVRKVKVVINFRVCVFTSVSYWENC